MRSIPLAILCSSGVAFAQDDRIAELTAAAHASVEAHGEALDDLADRIWRFAETSLTESRSSAAVADFLERQGFAIERGAGGVPTAFVARFGSGRPVVGMLCEFDALPGISNVNEPTKAPLARGAAGHGCGHNLFAAGSAGAALACKEVMENGRLPGTLVLFGCPAEETVIGKVYMAKAGVFDGLDVCLDWHPGDVTGADYERTRALNNFTVRFHGRTAHGSADPWNGRSALDAVELMNHAVNLLREHVEPSTRIHYVIPDGGGVPNVVPAEASVWYYVRDLERDGVEATYARVLKCAEGAAVATETSFDVELTTGVHSYLLNRTLTELLDKHLRAAGAPEWTEGEQSFAKKLQAATGKPEKGLFTGVRELPGEPVPARGGSTDAAEVSRIVPTGKLRVACAPIDTPWHAWPVVACAGTSIGHKCARSAARALGGALVELFLSPERISKARAEFAAQTAGKPYRSPIPMDQKLPGGN
ncbi:MAG: amidohydrolase [Planctomycetes bacterium]|nr:amidohydrolase [Planctomycetota bacterium]